MQHFQDFRSIQHGRCSVFHNLETLCVKFIVFDCVGIFFLSSVTIDFMLFTFGNRVPIMRYGASVVWHLSLPLIKSFNKTEAAICSWRLCFLRPLPFISLIGQHPEPDGVCTLQPIKADVPANPVITCFGTDIYLEIIFFLLIDGGDYIGFEVEHAAFV